MPKAKQQLKVAQVYYYVSNMDEAIKFYTETLGLPLRIRFDDYWAEVDAGTITLGLHPTEDGKKPKQGGGGTVSFQVEDIEALVEVLKKKGATVSEIHTPDRGKFAMVSDPDGNQMHVVEFSKKWKEENKY